MDPPGIKQEPGDTQVPRALPQVIGGSNGSQVSRAPSEMHHTKPESQNKYVLPLRPPVPVVNRSSGSSLELGGVPPTPNRGGIATASPSTGSSKRPNTAIRTGQTTRRTTSLLNPLQIPQRGFKQAISSLERQSRHAAEGRLRGGYNNYPRTAMTEASRSRRSPASGVNAKPAVTSRAPRSARGIARARGSDTPRAPTAKLSAECQLRGFNPVWQLDSLPGDRFSCDVKLLDHLVKGDGVFFSLEAAKNAAASKALEVVRAWPNQRLNTMRTPQQPSNAAQRGQRPAASRDIGRAATAEEGGDIAMRDGGHGGATMTVGPHSPGDGRAREEAGLLNHVRRVMGISLPNSTRDNPEAVRAFLEGLAVGSRLADASLSGLPSRNRSRSPAALRTASGAYRGRSPLRERERLTPPPGHHRPSPGRRLRRGSVYETWPSGSSGGVGGRWVHDRYRPDNDRRVNRR